MEFYVVDRAWKLQTILSTTGEVDHKVINATDVISLSPSRRLTLDVGFDKTTTSNIKEFTKVGNYVLYQDNNDDFVWQTILKTTHDPLNGVRTLECEDAGLDLLNETLPEYKADKAYNIAYYINKFTSDSGFKIGINEISKLTRRLEWDTEGQTATERIESVANQFDNAELSFSFKFDGNTLVQRYINIWKKRGKETDKTLYVNKDIHSIVVEEDIYELVNAVYATGGTPENKDNPINLKGYNYTDPTGRFLLKNGILYDTKNVKMWSRTNTVGHYFVRHLSYETTNQKTLLDTIIRHLKEYSIPVTQYVVDIANTDTSLRIGDTLRLVDENEELYLQSRIQELTYDYTTNSIETVLSDFKRLPSGISKQLQDMANNLQNDMNGSIPFIIEVTASNPVFINEKTSTGESEITLTCKVSRSNIDITNTVDSITWQRRKPDGTIDTGFSKTGTSIQIISDSIAYYTYEAIVET